jgi:TonB-linked SusC/RagA family outer membrane protein
LALASAGVCVLVNAGGRAVSAQSPDPSGVAVQLADRGPIFFASAERGRHAADVRTTSIFRQRVSLHLANATVADALGTLARQSGLELIYDKSALPNGARTSISADRLTIASALNEILLDTGLDVEVAESGFITLVRHGSAADPPSGARQGTTRIVGHVTDATLKTPLAQVVVRIQGGGVGASSDESGRYTLTGVAPGTYHVTARRVGYQPLTRDVTVSADQSATLDFALAAAPTKLDEVVTTAVGNQRRYQVGNVISTINADSIAPTAPITSLTDLISARAPGVQVLETSGLTGAGESIRIRGLTSLVLQNDPILIVDGVRQDNSAGGDLAAYFANYAGGTHPTPTRLNDIDFTDIATIDVLKGPAASTEYGTDAANGVIVITTKRGTAGRPQWRASAEQTESGMPVTFPDLYYSWGHTTDGTGAAVACPLLPLYLAYGDNTGGGTSGTCIADSVTKENPLNDPATSIFGDGRRGKYDLSVSGGSDAVRYYVAGGLSNETGIVRMPAVFRELADTAALGLPSSALGPNSEDQGSVRTNVAIRLGATADMTVTGNYLSTYQQTPNASALYSGVFSYAAQSGAAYAYGYGYPDLTPLGSFSTIGSENLSRVTGGMTGNWRPVSWFVGHATVGLDHESFRNQDLVYPLADPSYQGFSAPFLGVGMINTDVYSVDVRGTATAALTRGVRSATTAGVQLVDTRNSGQTASVSHITATNLTLNGATSPSVTQIGNRAATLGGYAEEQVAVVDRLFVTGALRLDAASGFGSAYSVAAYPKASVSWLALNGSATTVRVRAAFGESGVQPMNGAALQLYSATAAAANGAAVTGYGLSWPGNPQLRPERTAEYEGGVDIGAWHNRVSLELTAYAKMTHDALINENLGATLGSYTYQENIGDVRNGGVEAALSVTLIQAPQLTWDVTLNGSLNHNKLVSLAPGVAAQTFFGDQTVFRQAPGYPLYGLWGTSVSYADVNHDGVLEANEVTVADSATFIGSSTPTQEVSLGTHIGLWNGAVVLGALADYRGGYRIANSEAYAGADLGQNQLGQNVPTGALWEQARGVAGLPGFAQCCYEPADFLEDGSFVRLREVSLTYALPRRTVRTIRVQSLSLTGAVRNLALWTRYTGSDPEVSTRAVQFAPTSNSNGVNNDVREGYGAVPLARYWVLRLNVGL